MDVKTNMRYNTRQNLLISNFHYKFIRVRYWLSSVAEQAFRWREWHGNIEASLIVKFPVGIYYEYWYKKAKKYLFFKIKYLVECCNKKKLCFVRYRVCC